MKNPHAVRETLTRRQHGFRVKFPSRKMNVTMRCESLLERDAARYFEFAPDVASFLHNSEEFHYYDQSAQPHRYYPDFVVETVDGRQQRIEVKPKAVLDAPENAERYALIELRYVAVGQSFNVVTEEFLHAEPLKSTLHLLARNRGQRRLLIDLQRRVARLPEYPMSVDVVAKRLGGDHLVYQALANGLLSFDISLPLDRSSMVRRQGAKS